MEKDDYKESDEFTTLTPEQVWDFIVVASTFVANALRLPDDENTAAKVKLYRAFTVEGSSEPIYEDESAPSEVKPEAEVPRSPGFRRTQVVTDSRQQRRSSSTNISSGISSGSRPGR